MRIFFTLLSICKKLKTLIWRNPLYKGIFSLIFCLFLISNTLHNSLIFKLNLKTAHFKVKISSKNQNCLLNKHFSIKF